jgi:hypothetical protein
MGGFGIGSDRKLGNRLHFTAEHTEAAEERKNDSAISALSAVR